MEGRGLEEVSSGGRQAHGAPYVPYPKPVSSLDAEGQAVRLVLPITAALLAARPGPLYPLRSLGTIRQGTCQ